MVQVHIHSQTAGSQAGLSHGQRPWFLKALRPLFAGPTLSIAVVSDLSCDQRFIEQFLFLCMVLT